MKPLLEEIERRWLQMFADLAAGADVPPGVRLRTEGLMEAAVITGGVDVQQLHERMAHCYMIVCGEDLAASLGQDWREVFPFPQIPAMARRAPVYPSTPD